MPETPEWNLPVTEEEEVRDYIRRCRRLSPSEILAKLGEMRDFVWKYMPPEARARYLKEHGPIAQEEWDAMGKE